MSDFTVPNTTKVTCQCGVTIHVPVSLDWIEVNGIRYTREDG